MSLAFFKIFELSKSFFHYYQTNERKKTEKILDERQCVVSAKSISSNPTVMLMIKKHIQQTIEEQIKNKELSDENTSTVAVRSRKNNNL